MKNIAIGILINTMFIMCRPDEASYSDKFIIPLPEIGAGISYSSSSVWDGEVILWDTCVASQEERGKAYRNYIEHGLSRNELIGIHYFQWLDQPILGRFDGENYNIGLLTIAHTPYEELVDAMKESNLKIYEIITGGVPVYNEDVDIIPSIYF